MKARWFLLLAALPVLMAPSCQKDEKADPAATAASSTSTTGTTSTLPASTTSD